MQITGNEKLLDKPHVNKFLDFVAKVLLTIFVIGLLIGIVMFFEDRMNSYGMVFFIVFCIVFGVTGFKLGKPSKKNIEEFNRANKIFNQFRKDYPILNAFINDQHENLGVTSKQGENRDSMMFDIYMEAHKLGADAIVLNSDHAMSNTTGGMQTTSTGRQHMIQTDQAYNITATLVKYK